MDPRESHEVFTPQEAADRLRCNKRTVLRLLKAGTLPGFRIGSDWRIRADVLEAFTRGIRPDVLGRATPAPTRAKAPKARKAKSGKARAK